MMKATDLKNDFCSSILDVYKRDKVALDKSRKEGNVIETYYNMILDDT